jgi:tetratricopeptide (TPR) repeat protein
VWYSVFNGEMNALRGVTAQLDAQIKAVTDKLANRPKHDDAVRAFERRPTAHFYQPVSYISDPAWLVELRTHFKDGNWQVVYDFGRGLESEIKKLDSPGPARGLNMIAVAVQRLGESQDGHERQQKYAEAESRYLSAISVCSDDTVRAQILCNLGGLYQTQDKFEKAEECLEEGYSIDVTSPCVLFNLLCLESRRKNLESCHKWFDLLVRHSPNRINMFEDIRRENDLEFFRRESQRWRALAEVHRDAVAMNQNLVFDSGGVQ